MFRSVLGSIEPSHRVLLHQRTGELCCLHFVPLVETEPAENITFAMEPADKKFKPSAHKIISFLILEQILMSF